MVKWISPLQVLDVFRGILTTQPYHAKDYRLGEVLILHHLGEKMHTIIIKRALRGCNGVFGKGEKGKKYLDKWS